MAAAPTPLPPGSMTVPPLFGWGEVALVVLLVLLVALAALGALAAGRGGSGGSEWEAWLDGRSTPGGPGPQDIDTPSR
jgi:hypothetical protein